MVSFPFSWELRSNPTQPIHGLQVPAHAELPRLLVLRQVSFDDEFQEKVDIAQGDE